MAISSNPAQTSTGGPSQLPRSDQPETVSDLSPASRAPGAAHKPPRRPEKPSQPDPLDSQKVPNPPKLRVGGARSPPADLHAQARRFGGGAARHARHA